jgi:hypothetical protein
LWFTLWLILVLGALVALAVVAGPWVAGALTAVGVVSTSAVARSKGR